MGMILYCLLSMLVGFALQFLLCKKTQNTTWKYAPTYLVVLGWIFILLSSLGFFGNLGDSFYDFSFVALMLAVFFLPPTIGVIAADICNFVQKRKSQKSTTTQ